MIAIILSACLLSNGSVCREHRIPLPADVSAFQCMMTAQIQLARWSAEHPQWRIVRWRCRPDSQEDI
jgi:hypothetical protein